jgi:hypothetical protein
MPTAMQRWSQYFRRLNTPKSSNLRLMRLRSNFWPQAAQNLSGVGFGGIDIGYFFGAKSSHWSGMPIRNLDKHGFNWPPAPVFVPRYGPAVDPVGEPPHSSNAAVEEVCA